MKKIDKLINEMGRELLPSVSSKDDRKLLRQLKLLHMTDIEEFERKLKRINLVRKSEGLVPLHRNEILGKSVKKDIKKKLKSTKEEEKQQEKEKNKGKKPLYTEYKIITTPFRKKQKGKTMIKEIPFKIYGDDGKIYIHFKNEYVNPIDDMKKIEVDSPVPFRIVEKEIRFPTIKKVIYFNSLSYSDNHLRIKTRKL